jgi:hypothetical protein
MRRLTAVILALAVTTPSLARAAEPPCLSPGEFTALAEYALPSIISGATLRCSSALAPDAYLRRSGSQLVERFATRKPAAWPGAKAAFLKLSTSGGPDVDRMIRTLPDPSLQQMLGSLMEGLVSQQVPLERCTAIDRLIGLLSPLPAQSTAEVIALAVGLGSKAGRTKLGVISVCQS